MKLDSYYALEEYLLKGRNHDDRPLANNTRVVRIDNHHNGIKLHNTVVIKYNKEYNKDYELVLNTGGWKTQTTKNRMNDYQHHFHIRVRNRIWYLEFDENEYLYQDDMNINLVTREVRAGGVNLNPWSKKQEKRKKDEVRKINNYCKQFAKLFVQGEIDSPGGGDCWACLGMMLPDNNNHIESHIKEKYYVPSLLKNAIQENPGSLSIMDNYNIQQIWNGSNEGTYGVDLTQDRIKKVLQKYIFKRFGMGF